MTYKDKVVLVTGGSKGIGEGCVRVFVEAGSKVVFCSRGQQAGKTMEAEVNKKGPGQSHFIACDVSQVDQIKSMIDATITKYGRLDCLINNAGWHPPHKTIEAFHVASPPTPAGRF